VRVAVGAEFLREIEQFRLRFCCRDCRFHVPEADACAHGWPDRLHREPPLLVADRGEVVFCKEFELV
jgi:hypothetical protein